MKKKPRFTKRFILSILISLIAVIAIVATVLSNSAPDECMTTATQNLRDAVDSADRLLGETYISADGTGRDVPPNQHYVSQSQYDEFQAAINAARAVLDIASRKNYLEGGGARLSIATSYVDEEYVDIFISLDKNPLIWNFILSLAFDNEVLECVAIGKYELPGFVLAEPQAVGGRFADRRVFLAYTLGLEASDATGLIFSARFKIIGEINNVLPLHIGYFNFCAYHPDYPLQAKRYLISACGRVEYGNEPGEFSAMSMDRDRGLYGDANNDGRVDDVDTRLVAHHVAGTPSNFPVNRIAADVNRDGNITLGDATTIAQIVLGRVIDYFTFYDYYMVYRILTNSAGGAGLRAYAESIMDNSGASEAVRDVFRREFSINLVRQSSDISHDLNIISGCLAHGNNVICVLPTPNPNPPPAIIPGSGCGTNIDGSDCNRNHHRSSNHFVRTPASPDNVNTFRFVNFRLCSYDSSRDPRPRHNWLYGAATSGLTIQRDIIVSTAHSDRQNRITTAHEISHLLGALDGGCTIPPFGRELCVMSYEAPSVRTWCDNHKNAIETRLARLHAR